MAKFSRFASEVFENSLVNGIPQIVSAKGRIHKFLRVLVFVSCLVGFFYQSTVFMLMYLSYPTVLDVVVTSPKSTVLPATTVCTLSRFTLKEFCPLNSCIWMTRRKACRKYSYYCNYETYGPSSLTLVPSSNWSHYYWMEEKEFAELRDVAFSIRNSQCYLFLKGPGVQTSCSVEYPPSVRSALTIPPDCMVYNSHVGNPNTDPIEIPRNARMENKIQSHKTFYIPEVQYATLHISFHSPYAVSNPFVDGKVIKLGNAYQIKIKEEVFERLPAPYETDCVDYIQLWKSRGGHGPTNKKECIEECKFNLSMAENGCVIHTIWYPHNERRCNPDDSSSKLFLYSKICGPKCKLACREISYIASAEETPDFAPHECLSTEKAVPSMTSKLFVTFNPLQRTSYIYKPKYNFIETFSYIGGYIGIWLGISMIAVFNFFENLTMIAKYPFSVKQKKISKTSVQVIKNESLFQRRNITPK